MSSTEPSSSTSKTSPSSDKPLHRAQTLPLHTTTVVEIVGQVPEPLSPSDKTSSAQAAETSLTAAILQQRATQSTEAQHQIQAESVSPESSTSARGISLPLPASSSLVEPEQQFPRPLRTQTVPATFTTASGEAVSPQAIISSKTFPVTDASAAVEPNPTMSGQQPFIAELPGTPVPQDRDEGADTKRMDKEIALEQSARLKATKSEDAAVIYDIPVTPSAQAFEVANTNTIGKGYFEPKFPGDQEVEAPKVEAA